MGMDGYRDKERNENNDVVYRLTEIPSSSGATESETVDTIRKVINWKTEDTINVVPCVIAGKQKYICHTRPGNYTSSDKDYKIVDIVTIGNDPSEAIDKFSRELEQSNRLRQNALNLVTEHANEIIDCSVVPVVIWRGDTAFPNRYPTPNGHDIDLLYIVRNMEDATLARQYADELQKSVPLFKVDIIVLDKMKNHTFRPYEEDCLMKGVVLKGKLSETYNDTLTLLRDSKK